MIISEKKGVHPTKLNNVSTHIFMALLFKQKQIKFHFNNLNTIPTEAGCFKHIFSSR